MVVEAQHSAKNLTKAPVGDFKVYPQVITADLSYLRPNTQFNPHPMNFLFQQGGMGDYICWTPALQWLVKEAPWVYGRIFAPQYFIQFLEHFFDDVPNWKIYLHEDFSKFGEQKSLIRAPSDQQPQLINAVGAHLMDIGFGYFANLCPRPADAHYPELSLDDTRLPAEVKSLKGKYAVFTPGGTTLARITKGTHINPLVKHVKALGLTPVFLGKHHLADIHKAFYDDDIAFNEGLDLREKTSILDAAAIMKYAKFTIGLDNGLLHLAACTDASIIFGYNIAHPSQRRPIRRQGKMEEIILTQKDLACIHCQTNVKLLCYHNFKNCLYEDSKCIDVLFENEGERWKAAIQKILA